MLQALLKSHKDLASVYNHHGDLNMQSTNWQEAFKYFHLAYQIKEKKRPLNHPDIGTTFNNIANYYKAIPTIFKHLNDDHRRVICLQALANFYHQQNLNQRATDLCHEHLSFHEQHLSENHMSIAHLLIVITQSFKYSTGKCSS
jgi:predicted Zn-dependent protease